VWAAGPGAKAADLWPPMCPSGPGKKWTLDPRILDQFWHDFRAPLTLAELLCLVSTATVVLCAALHPTAKVGPGEAWVWCTLLVMYFLAFFLFRLPWWLIVRPSVQIRAVASVGQVIIFVLLYYTLILIGRRFLCWYRHRYNGLGLDLCGPGRFLLRAGSQISKCRGLRLFLFVCGASASGYVWWHLRPQDPGRGPWRFE
jgi:hypothetical protein